MTLSSFVAVLRNLIMYGFTSRPVEYQTYPSMQWHPAKYEESVILQLLRDQFPTFVKKVKTTDCQAELRRLLATGPPIYISDKHALPLPDNGDTHICKLWFSSDDTERSAKLEGALEGEERKKLLDELNEFIIEDGREEGDDDADASPAPAEL